MDVARRRLHSQRLAWPTRTLASAPLEAPEDVVRWLGAVQAQDYAGAKWALAQRTRACTDAAVEEAFAAGRIVRTHVLRPTWHFVAPADVRWLLALTAPHVRAALAYYDRKLAIDAATLRRSRAAMGKALEGGNDMTREELSRVLRSAGIEASGQRLGHLVMHAELDAMLCSGPRRGKQFTYALLDERAPPAPARERLPRDEALAELTRRFFVSHGPALAQDCAWWSGLTMKEVKRGIEIAGPHLAHERDGDGGKVRWFAAPEGPPRYSGTVVHLLPNFDEYVVAYKDRGAYLDPALSRRRDTRRPSDNLLASPVVVLNGKAVGEWRRTFGKGAAVVEAKIFVPLTATAKRALERAAQRFGRFLGMRCKLHVR